MSETKKTVSTSDCPKVSYREIIGFDANGEIVYDVVKKHCWENGSGFVISYIDAICDLVKKSDITGSTLRLFLYIAHNQPYGSDGLHFGFSSPFIMLFAGLRENNSFWKQKSMAIPSSWLIRII